MIEEPPYQPDHYLIGFIEDGQADDGPVSPAQTIEDLYRVVYRPEDDPGKHSCGLISDFPEVTIGSVVRCRTCGRYWKRRNNWIDGDQRWSCETHMERRRRTRRNS